MFAGELGEAGLAPQPYGQALGGWGRSCTEERTAWGLPAAVGAGVQRRRSGQNAEGPHPEFSGYSSVRVNHGPGCWGARDSHIEAVRCRQQPLVSHQHGPTAVLPPPQPQAHLPRPLPTACSTATHDPGQCGHRRQAAVCRGRGGWSVGGGPCRLHAAHPTLLHRRSREWSRGLTSGKCLTKGHWAWCLVLQMSFLWAFLNL